MFYNLSISVILILFFNKKYFSHKRYINKASTLVTRIYIIIIYIPITYQVCMYKKLSLNYKKGGCLNNKYLRDL